jgi:hypothetical protein
MDSTSGPEGLVQARADDGELGLGAVEVKSELRGVDSGA